MKTLTDYYMEKIGKLTALQKVRKAYGHLSGKRHEKATEKLRESLRGKSPLRRGRSIQAWRLSIEGK